MVTRKTVCCIVGGGPAGVMLGFLLARAGVEVVVLEKHADFFRDFRGDTIHPSTMQVMDELGLLDDLLKIKHSKVQSLSGSIGGVEIRIADFSHVPGRSKFLAFMPQWDFLKFLTDRAQAYPSFHLEMNAQAIDLLREGDRITGVTVERSGVSETILADLVVAADGRHSTLRQCAGMEVVNTGAPMDVLWTRISRLPSDPPQTFGTISAGGILVLINRIDYYQCAYVIRKGGFDAIKARGLSFLRDEIVRFVPRLKGRIDEIASWDDVKLLSVAVDHLETWYRSGLLCIGDAAHAMSPIGGVGINLAIQDAVASANLLCAPLASGSLASSDLQAVQRRREPPTRKTQALQVFIQNRVITGVLASGSSVKVPVLLRLVSKIPLLRRIPAYIVGIGFRPEHVRAPDMAAR